MLGVLSWFASSRSVFSPAILFSTLIFAAAGLAGAQSVDEATNWVTDSWQTETGLPHNSVTAVLQTWEGYLWVGTLNGLARFDGLRFTTFRSADTPGLRSNRILCLYEDAYGALWIGTEGGGLACYDSGQFTALGSEEGLSSDTVLCLGEDKAGRLWVGTDSGLNLYEGRRFTTFFKTDGLPDDRVTVICQPIGMPLLISTRQRLCQYRREALAGFEAPLSPGAQTNLTCLREDHEGRLWMGGETGLFRLPAAGANDAAQPLQAQPKAVLALVERREHETWFGTRSGELCRVVTNENTLGGEVIWRSQCPVTALCEDREGNLWVGTAGEGLRRVKPRRLRLVPWPETQVASGSPCLFLTPEGELRLVGGDKNLYGWQDGAFALRNHLPLPDGVGIQTACQTRDGEIWVGTLRDGLFECGPDEFQQFSERAGISDSAIQVLCGDGADGLWIGTRNSGLNHLKNRMVARFNTPWGFLGTYASALERDSEGKLWIGTTGDGLFCLRGEQFTRYATASGLPSNQICALHADGAGSLWVGTDKGLCRIRDGRVTTFAGGNGLPEEAVLQLDSDRAGTLWIGAANRIYRASREQLDAFARGREPFVSVVSYGKEDGLPGIQCMPRVQWPRRDNGGGGDVYLATTRGLLVVEKGGRPWNHVSPPVVLEAVFVNNATVPFRDGVRVAPGKGTLRFEYTALSLTAPGKVRFRYRLEGFDTDWSELDTSREARYPKVPPGNYRFQVVACNSDGVWNESGAGVAIAVVPFWWETLWFRWIVALAVAGAVAGFYQMRRMRRREIQRLRVRIAGDLHDDIGSSLWSITLLSRMLTKHGNLGPQERQDLEEIHRIAVQTSNSIRDIIWLINPAFDSLQDLVSRTQDFAGTLLRGVEYRMNCQGIALSRKLPFDFRHNLLLFFKEALTNIARHAQATVVEVRIEEQGNLWRLTLRDNGRGFDPAAITSGNGLRNLRARAARMKAAFEVESRPCQGTRLTLSSLHPD
jgi:ligand-binding sensor domain-containing protein/signal transduction histidine kinase